MTVRTILESAMKSIGVIAAREVANLNDLNDALEVFQSMLRMWAARRLLIYASVRESKVLTAGVASYTWGSGGNINTTRPMRILGAFIRDVNNFDHPVEIISEEEYNGIAVKTTQARPDRLFFHPLYPLASIYLYSTPDAAETLWIISMKQFTETSSFAALEDEIDFPPEYQEPMITNLAFRLAPRYGKSTPQEVSVLANSGIGTISTINAANQVQPVFLSGPWKSGGSYDINEG